MAWLNYHHLLYFWTVAREGSVTRACGVLHLTQPAISAQIRTLERSLGEKLFEKRGRNLALTETGVVVYRYADEIFTLGRELQQTIAGHPSGRPVRISVGVVDAIPKLLVYRLLAPALRISPPVRLVLRDDRLENLLTDLALHRLDIILSDTPLPHSTRVKAFSSLLGECGVTIFATSELAKRHKRGFPASLEDAPFLLPTENTMLRRSLDQWFDRKGLTPRIVAEIEDSAVLKALGQAGIGLFVAPSAIEREVRRQYSVNVVGRISEVREQYYAIAGNRKIRQPAVLAITGAARNDLFAE